MEWLTVILHSHRHSVGSSRSAILRSRQRVQASAAAFRPTLNRYRLSTMHSRSSPSSVKFRVIFTKSLQRSLYAT